MSKVCLFGASGHGKVIKDVILSTSNEVEVFFDDNPKHKHFHDIPILPSEKIANYKNNLFLISIGDNAIRKEVSEKMKMTYTTAIHNKAVVSTTVSIQEGTVVMGGVVVNSDAEIGRHVILNTNSVIEHDCRISDFVHISPNATITGNVNIGEGAHIGSAAIILPNVKVGKWAIIGAGAVIINDVPDYAVVVGNPGRIIKYNN